MITIIRKIIYRVALVCSVILSITACSTSNADFNSSTTRISIDNLSSLFPTGSSPQHLSFLKAVYAGNNAELIWQDNEAKREFHQQLAEVALANVHPQFTQWTTTLAQSNLSEVERDLLLSDMFISYLHYVEEVKNLGHIWLYQRNSYKPGEPSTELIGRWQEARSNRSSFINFLKSLAPQNAMYSSMRKSFNTFLQYEDSWNTLKITRTIKQGNALSAAEAEALKGILNFAAVWSNNSALRIDDVPTAFNGNIISRIKQFQTIHGISADGSIGPGTRVWLNKNPKERAALLALNIQRVRLLPDSYVDNIMVNIPEYALTFYSEGAIILESKVIVGRPDRKTPLMKSALNNVVLNPPWNVPTKMMREDIIPRLKRDPSYVFRAGYTIYSSWGRDARVIDPTTVNWSNVSAKNANYRFQQAPGRNNALGRYKFNMPNTEAIYLHDTPNHNLFSRTNRAISSGCIRVNKSTELVNILLNPRGWNDGRIRNAITGQKTQHLGLKTQVPVQLYYQTAWADRAKVLQFRDDIYSYDSMPAISEESLLKIRNLIK